jgi:methionyl-tRNA synthetase
MMNQPSIEALSASFGMSLETFVVLFLFAALWSIFWKGWALWIAARNTHKAWFVILLLVNTLGILEIIYIFAVGKKAESAAQK